MTINILKGIGAALVWVWKVLSACALAAVVGVYLGFWGSMGAVIIWLILLEIEELLSKGK